MLAQRCALDQHRLILPVSITKPRFEDGAFRGQPGQSQYRALVDTGAQRTVVSRAIIAEQKLTRTGHMEFSGLHGARTHSKFLASLGFWVRRVEKLQASTHFDANELSLFVIDRPFEIVDMDQNRNFDLILGFDVLKLTSFSFDADTQSFEIRVKL